MVEPLSVVASTALLSAICHSTAARAGVVRTIVNNSTLTTDKEGVIHRYLALLARLEDLLGLIETRPPSNQAEAYALHKLLEQIQELLSLQAADYQQNARSTSSRSRTESVRRVLWAVRDRDRLMRAIDELEILTDSLSFYTPYSQTIEPLMPSNPRSLMLGPPEPVKASSPRSLILRPPEPVKASYLRSLTLRQPEPTKLLYPTLPSSPLQICREPVDGSHDVDIIFIHGLGSSSQSTWAAFNVNWPVDLLPRDLPSARILTYDYSMGPPAIIRKGKVQLVAKALITDIEINSQEQPTSVPIVFVAHSFGGLVLKSALAYCHRAKSFDDSSRSLLSRTRGIMFMGVPSLQGTTHVWLREFLSRIDESAQAVDYSTTFQIAKESTAELCDLFKTDADLFRDICSSRGWSVVNFYETERTRTRFGPFSITSESNISFQDTVGFLDGDHFSMCKFQTRDDDSYKIVRQKLGSMLKGQILRIDSFSSRAPAKRTEPVSEILQQNLVFQKRLEKFLIDLGDPFDIKSSQSHTIHQPPGWLFEEAAYDDWARGDAMFLHLCGPAGTGKTYLARQIVRSLTSAQISHSQLPQAITVITHFVDWRWHPQDVPESMLRSFIFQLLKMHPDLFRLIINRPEYQLNAYDDLLSLFFHLLGRLSDIRVHIVVDGLEDAHEAVQSVVCKTLSKLSSPGRRAAMIKVLITSRSVIPDGGIDVDSYLIRCLDLRQVAQRGSRNREIRSFVENAVSAIPIGHKISASARDRLKNSLCEQVMVRGKRTLSIDDVPVNDDQSPLNNFVWISAAVALIISKTSPVEINNAMNWLMDGGQTLRDFYQQMIDTTILPGNIEFRRVLRFLLAARRPLSVPELEFALGIEREHKSVKSVLDAQTLTLRDALEEHAPGLIVFEDDRVCLIHRRLKLYLQRSHFAEEERGNTELALACLRTLLLDPPRIDSSSQSMSEILPDMNISEQAASQGVFVDYCNTYWFKHVQKAKDSIGILDQVSHLCQKFMHNPTYDKWLKDYQKQHPRLRFPKRRTWIHHLAGLDLLRNNDLLNLVKNHVNDRDLDYQWAPIHFAVVNEANKSTEILARGLSKDVVDYKLLEFASMAGECTIMSAILESEMIEVDPSILVYAVAGRHHAAFKCLTDYFKRRAPSALERWNWNTWSDAEGGVLHHCTRARNFRAVTTVVKYGASPSAKIRGRIALHTAAQVGEIDILRFFLDSNPSLLEVTEDSTGNTPIHYAAEVGFIDGVREILNNLGAYNLKNNAGHTPLSLAAKGGHVGIVKLLITFGADVNSSDNNGNVPLHLASAVYWTEVVEMLLNTGADPNRRDYHGRTALHLAAANGALEIVTVLIRSGVDIQSQDSQGQTALHIAASRGMDEVVKGLISAGASASSQDRYGKTPLHLAIDSAYPSPRLVEYLLEHGAQVSAKDQDNRTAMDYAENRGNSHFLAILADAQLNHEPSLPVMRSTRSTSMNTTRRTNLVRKDSPSRWILEAERERDRRGLW